MANTNRLPTPLSRRTSGGIVETFDHLGEEYDVAIGGVPFRLATSGEVTEAIEMVPIRREQIDTEIDPGEQSLAVWWRRSQTSWHEGAGFTHQESLDGRTPHLGFDTGRTIDPFVERGQLHLGHVFTPLPSANAYSDVLRANIGTGGKLALPRGTAGLTLLPAFLATSGATTHAPAGKTVTDGIIVGDKFLDVTAEGDLYYGDVSDPSTASAFTLGAAASRVYWAKHRPWVIGGNTIWQPDLSTPGAVAAEYENPDDGWTYTCLTEGPAAVYIGGHDGVRSSIMLVTFDTNGQIPDLSIAEAVLLPRGELVLALDVLAGQYLGILTDQGFRVGTIRQDGSVVYGPLLIEEDVVKNWVGLTNSGRYFHVMAQTQEDEGIAFTVDTGTQLAENVFPYALTHGYEEDLLDPVGYPLSILTLPSGLLGGVTSEGRRFYASLGAAPSGEIDFGRVRFGTTEPKIFTRVEIVTAAGSAGNVEASLMAANGTSLPLGLLDPLQRKNVFDIDYEPQEWMSLRLTLTNDGGGTETAEGPVIESWLIKAVPAVRPQWRIVLPLLCFDREQAKSGQVYGRDGFARDRLNDIMEIGNGVTFTFQDFRSGTPIGRRCMIQGVRYLATSVPDPVASGPGGILQVEMVTVD